MGIGIAILKGSSKAAQAAARGLKGFDSRMREKQARKFTAVKQQKIRPLPDNKYTVIMSNEDKAKLGISGKW